MQLRHFHARPTRTGIAQVLGCHIVTQPLLSHFLQNLYQLKALDWLFYATKFQQVSSDISELITEKESHKIP